MPMGVAEFSAATMGTRYLTPSSDEVSESTNLGRWKLAATNMDSSRIRSPHNRIGQDARVCYQDWERHWLEQAVAAHGRNRSR